MMFRSLPLLALILVPYSATTLAAPEPHTNLAMGPTTAEAPAELDTALSDLMMPREDAESNNSPSIKMECRQDTQFIEEYGQFNLPCNISAVNVTLAMKYVALFTFEVEYRG